MANTPKRFVILSDSRSGTSLLSETLNVHPQILCHGEVFHPKPSGHIKVPLEAKELEDLVALRENDTPAFMDWVFDHPDFEAVGFKIWRNQNPDQTDALMADDSVFKIIYERTNVLARFSSSRLVQATGIYNLKSDANRPTKLDTKITFNEAQFSKYLDSHRELFTLYREKSRGPVLDITYEEIKNNGFASVLDFLGLSFEALEPQKKKLHGSSIIDRFEPSVHNAIITAVTGAGHAEWVSEG
ncbi:hypothetical protein ABVF61_26575 [Roseibium sp. HPY-6]|uniref:hypothetical protein n=1 Tax=Roseibium sp. HPY-6 TaxID=3229852 RepID=UPI003390347C